MSSTCGAETAYRYEAPEFNPGFGRVRVAGSLKDIFCVVFCRSLFFLNPFSCVHCFVCPASYYSFGIFRPFPLFIRLIIGSIR